MSEETINPAAAAAGANEYSASKITVLDTRYVMSQMLGNLVDFSTADDVLFIYSTTIINNSTALR